MTYEENGNRIHIAALFLAFLAAPLWLYADANPPQVDYLRDIKPIFETSCFGCHGPGQQMMELRLDRKEDALKGGVSGPALVAGKSEESLLYQLLVTEDEGKRMPLNGKPLEPEQVALIKTWIDQGAHWAGDEDIQVDESDAKHWSYRPIAHVDPPEVKGAEWVRNPVDAFVLAKLEEKGFKPSPEADRRTLIRRLYLDLTGLLPTPQEVEAFVQDESPDAYEKQVDSLLASPHFGERWGRHWLDLARYADSDGYEKDSPRPFAWRYRDWVIDAYNRDLPFDRFTIEQIAGDLLPNPTIDQITATGFHRNTLTNKEGGVDQEEFRVKAVKDRVNTTSTVWLGLTVQCAECHNHKYDQISQKEYYGMYAFFNSADEKDVSAPFPEEQSKYEKEKQKFDLVYDKLIETIDLYKDIELPARQAAWERSLKRDTVEWTPLHPASAVSTAGAKMRIGNDGVIAVSGDQVDKDTYTVEVNIDLKGLSAVRLEVYPTGDKDNPGPGRAPHGNFVLSEFRATAAKYGDEAPVDVPFASVTADYSQGDYDVSKAVDGDPETGWAVSGQTGMAHVAVFEVDEKLALSGDTTLTFHLEQNYGKRHSLARFRLFVTGADRPVKSDGIVYDLHKALDAPLEQRTAEQKVQVAALYAQQDPLLQSFYRTRDELQKTAPPKPGSYVRAFEENEKGRTARIHTRGDFLRPGDPVEPHTLRVLNSLRTGKPQPDRLDLALWLVSPDNPLTARVTVNRYWQNLFGAGLVATEEDFGTRGEAPSHPELLDWLAHRFMKNGWSRKDFIKTVVVSSTYRQSSATRKGLVETDPKNRLLARQNRFRVEGEIVRDLNLAVSGLLNPKIGGDSIRPPMPGDIAALGYANQVKWAESKGDEKYRRGMYIFFQRTVPYPMLVTFDSPEGSVSCTRRERSNTPLQALTVLNDPVFFECAQYFGKRMMLEGGGTVESRIRFAVRTALGREATAAEIEILNTLYQKSLRLCKDDPKSALEICGDCAVENADPAETASCISVARALINLEEFFTRE